LLVGATLLALAAMAGAFALLHHNGGGGNGGIHRTASVQRVALTGAGALDPYGPGNSEHADRASNATDADPTTYWNTETYRDGLQKPGVGLVVQTASPRTLKTITVSTTTPGFTADIRTAADANGASRPGEVDSASQTVGTTATFKLRGKSSTYWVVWITDLGSNSRVQITDVKATG
jgi:putative peptidoglycan lipid II flippase